MAPMDGEYEKACMKSMKEIDGMDEAGKGNKNGEVGTKEMVTEGQGMRKLG